MIAGGICTYPKGSRLAAAVKFLRAHRDKVELVTIDVGVNDILFAGWIVGVEVDVECRDDVFGQIAATLPVILQALREAAAPGTPIVGMNYYNSFLAFWLAGPEGQGLAMESAGLATFLNFSILGPTYAAFGIPVADVASAFQSDDFTLVPFPLPAPNDFVPLNVATICTWTYMCVPGPVGPNVHATPTGYGVIAGAFAAVLP